MLAALIISALLVAQGSRAESTFKPDAETVAAISARLKAGTTTKAITEKFFSPAKRVDASVVKKETITEMPSSKLRSQSTDGAAEPAPGDMGYITYSGIKYTFLSFIPLIDFN